MRSPGRPTPGKTRAFHPVRVVATRTARPWRRSVASRRWARASGSHKAAVSGALDEHEDSGRRREIAAGDGIAAHFLRNGNGFASKLESGGVEWNSKEVAALH